MNRRELLTTAGALALVGCGPAPAGEVAGGVAADDVFSGAKLMADVEAYVGFGTHRTGSAGDLATSDWFASYWRGLGYEIEQMDVETPNADTTVARIVAGGAAFDGFAQPPLSFTPEAGITGKLVRWDEASSAAVKGHIAYVHIPRAPGGLALGADYRAAFQKAAAAGAIGVVAAMSGPSGEVVAINTPVAMKLDIPVLQLGDRLKPQLDGIVDVGQDVTLTIKGPGGTRVGRNTVARYGAEGPWIIISTPQSGWFTCAVGLGDQAGVSGALAVRGDEWA